MSQLNKLNSMIDDASSNIKDIEVKETQVVQTEQRTSPTESLTKMIVGRMEYATDDQKHRASQIITHLMAKISGNAQVFGMFIDKANIANTARIVTQIVNLDLPFAGQEMYYIIPYKNTLSLQLSYQGMLEIAYRAGGVYNVQTNTVYEGDDFEFYYSSTNHFLHRPKFSSEIPLFYYATCKVVAGKENDLLLCVMSQQQMISFKQKYSRGNPLWNSDFNNMAKKTVLKQLLKLCPKRPVDTQLLQEIGDENE